MSILSYKQYKLLHENLDSVIGVSTPTSIGLKNEAPQLYNMMSKMAKKMAGGPPNLKKKPPMGGDDMGMGDPDMGGPDMGMGDPDMGDDMGGLSSLKKKPSMGDEDDDMDDMDDGDEHPDDDDEDDMGGDDDGDEDDMGGDDDGDEDDMGGDDDGDEDDMGGDMMGGGMGPMGAGSPPPGMGGPMGGPDMGMGLGGPPPMKGKGKKPPMMMNKMGMPNYMNYMKKEAADPQDAKMKGQNRKNGACDQDDAGSGPASKKTTIKKEAADPQDAKMKGQNRKNGANDQNDAGSGPASKKTTTVRESKCCDKCGNMMSKKCNKMTKEQREFNDSLQRQAGALKFTQDEYGYWVPVKEDVLVPQAKQQASEPEAGEVGFAPQAKIGILGSNFTEWAARHTKSVKKKK